MKYSIITVVYNSLPGLKETYKSVKSQSYHDYEYLIIDGASKDGTADYLMEIVKKDDRVKFISEQDQGIYDAMNKGISIAKGEYIVFLGAADTFFSQDTLSEVAELLTDQVDILYGKCMYSSGDKINQSLGHRLSFLSMILDWYVAHQSVYAKRELLIKYPFDIRYSAQADQDFMIHMDKIGCKMKYVDKILAFYDGEGFSSDESRYYDFYKERIDILRTYHPIICLIRQFEHLLFGKK